jgi:hypothetical protein
MAERARGNIFYEILIVILIIGLIGTILYPSKIWKSEEEFENICQSRMEALAQLEYNYLQKYNAYSDSIPALKDELLLDPEYAATLDSLIYWDALVTRKDLEKIVKERKFPDDLLNFIQMSFESNKPLGNLVIWDSLGYRLMGELQDIVGSPEFAGDDSLDEGVNWVVLVGEDAFWNILETADVSRTVRRRIVSDLRRGRAIWEASDWEYYRPMFYDRLRDYLDMALRKDVWTKEQDDAWEEWRRNLWNEEMDNLAPELQDSIWQGFQQRLWDRDKELIWKKERNRLWKQEGSKWIEENTASWQRSLVQKWQQDRKKEWESETLSSLPDSLAGAFAAEKDSLWKDVVDSLQAEEYETWEQSNKKFVSETIRTIWESDRRVSWEGPAREEWLAEKEANKDVLWRDIKEELWKSEGPRLWRNEETKLAQKFSAQKRLDQAVAWNRVLGADKVRSIIGQLQLPDTQTLWNEIHKRMKVQDKAVGLKKKVSMLNEVGVVGLFRNTLLDSIGTCPLAHQPYLIEAFVETNINRFTIHCPIVDTSDVKFALRIDPVTNDTSRVSLGLSAVQKIFGGGNIKTHGYIDAEGKKSWDRRGS